MTSKTKKVFLLISFLLASSHALAQKPTPTPERPRAIVNLLNDARLAAPELAVDTFLKVIESKKVTDPAWRKEILDEAWRMADDVKYPVQRDRAYYGSGVVDTVSGYMAYAHELKLNALSLKARVIKHILADDKLRARQILFQIGGDLNLKPLSCEDPMGYVVGDIYAAVGAVAKGSFNSKEISEGVRGLFLIAWVENIQSPSQVMPLVDLLSELPGPTSERQMLIHAFERSINRSFADDRSFSRAFQRGPYQVVKFINSFDENSSLIAAWRDFLAKNAAGSRCSDTKPLRTADLPWPINIFNGMFPREKRFAAEDFASVEYRGVPKDKLYLDSPTYKKISLLFKTAREAKNLPENREDMAARLDWQLKVSETLEGLDSWKASGEESEAEVFNQKAVFYRVMIPEVDDPQTKIVVLRAFMRYLAGSAMQKDSFIEWLYHARWLAVKEPKLFSELTLESPNPNFKVMATTNRLLAESPKPEPVEAPGQPPAQEPKPTPAP